MINIRSVATLGIGFGIAAISVIGFVSEAPVTIAQESLLGGGGAKHQQYYVKPKPEQPKKQKVKARQEVKYFEPIKIEIPSHISEEHEEETIIVFLLSELFRRDLI
jgi:hypothetical protein